MKTKYLFLISCLIFSFQTILSQIDVTRVLDGYIGKWETTYNVTEGIAPGIAKEVLTIDGSANNTYLHINLTGWMVGDSIKYKWVEEQFITYDMSSGGLCGFYISSNGSDWAQNLKGKWNEQDNSIEVKGESKYEKIDVTWQLKNDKLYKNVEWINKESKKKEKIVRVFNKLAN
ncbi:MAG: hypothetical protein EHM58_12720 [Ignavibacteriae bacterium]|nr:MAG: hypothetical protein EHM58_12720 [Ignavibacteriota bacterium]